MVQPSVECCWARDIELMKTKGHVMRKTLGGTSNPFDAFLLINGMKTLEVRMERHCQQCDGSGAFPGATSGCSKSKLYWFA